MFHCKFSSFINIYFIYYIIIYNSYTITNCITYCLYFSSLKELPGQEAAILSYIDPLVAVLVSVTLLGESMTAMQVIGGTLILGFTLLNELSPFPKAKKE